VNVVTLLDHRICYTDLRKDHFNTFDINSKKVRSSAPATVFGGIETSIDFYPVVTKFKIVGKCNNEIILIRSAEVRNSSYAVLAASGYREIQPIKAQRTQVIVEIIARNRNREAAIKVPVVEPIGFSVDIQIIAFT